MLSLPFVPIVSVGKNQEKKKEVAVVDYINGLASKYECYNDYRIQHLYYAHRNYPSVFVQEIQIKNKRNQLFDLDLILPRIVGDQGWPGSTTQSIKIQHGSKMVDFLVTSG